MGTNNQENLLSELTNAFEESTEVEVVDKMSIMEISEDQKNRVRQDYDLDLGLEKVDADNLIEKTAELVVKSNVASTEMGRIFRDIKGILVAYGDGKWMKFCTNINYNYKKANRLIKRYNFIMDNIEKRQYLETLPLTLLYHVSEENCDAEIREGVLEGTITTLKEYREWIEHDKNQLGSLEEWQKKIEKAEKTIKESYKTLHSISDIEKLDLDKMSRTEKEEAAKDLLKVQKILKKYNLIQE